jgi:hypothetical protein
VELEDVAALPAARFTGAVLAPDPDSARTVGDPVALLVTETLPDLVPVVEGVKVAVTVQLAPTASDDPQLFVCEKSPEDAIEESVAVAVPVFFSIDVCVALEDPTLTLPKARLLGVKPSTALAGGGVVPPPPNTCSSDNWPAAHPEFAVMLIRTYRAFAAVNGIVTVFPVDGSNVYVDDAARLPNVVPSVLPCTESVWVRVAQAVAGGRFSVTLLTLVDEPRSTCTHCGNAPFALSQ